MYYLSVQVVRELLPCCRAALKHDLLNGAGSRNEAVASITVSRISLGFLTAGWLFAGGPRCRTLCVRRSGRPRPVDLGLLKPLVREGAPLMVFGAFAS